MTAAFLAHRAELLAFLRSRNAGEAAEDLLQEIWMRLPADDADIHTPLSYLYRMANSLVIDRYKRQVHERRRDTAWSEVVGPAVAGRSEQPAADRVLEARQTADRVLAALQREGDRVFRIFQRHRIDGLTQREVAAELGVSVGTVEGDLRRACRALTMFRDADNEE